MQEPAFKKLIAADLKGPFVTIMLNTHVGHQAVDQDLLQFKNFAKQAKERFVKNYGADNWKPFQEQMDSLLQDAHFWRNASKSLALVFHTAGYETFRLDIPVDDQYYVSDLPYLLALIKNTQFNYHYYLLALTRDAMKLYEVSHQSLELMQLTDDAPTDMLTTLGDELSGGYLNYTSQGAGSRNGSKEGVAYHGVSTKDAEEQIDWQNYYQAIDNYLKNFLPHKDLPLFVAALPENHALYRKLSKLDQLDKKAYLNVSPAGLDALALEKELPKLTEQLVAREVAEYQTLMNLKTQDQLVDISQAARLGKVAQLFIATSNLVDGYGEDPDTEYDRRQVLNRIAFDVLSNGGNVHVLEQEKAPDEKSLVAILRY